MLSSSSPKLFAGIRVLHRLLMPRHPPVALKSLTKKNFDYGPLTKEVLQAVSPTIILLDAASKGCPFEAASIFANCIKMKILQASIYVHESKFVISDLCYL